MRGAGAIVPAAEPRSAKEQAVQVRDKASAALADVERRSTRARAELEEAEAEVEASGLRLAEGEGAEASLAFQAATLRVAEVRARVQAFDTSVVPTAQGRLAAAEMALSDADRAEAYAAALKLRDQAASDLEAFLTELGPTFQAVLLNLSKAQLAVAAVNRRRPAGAAPIIDPETKARSARPAERTLVFNEVVKQWTHADGRRVADLLVRQVRNNGDGTGAIGPDSKAFGAKRSPEKVYLRPWRHSGWHVSGSSPHLGIPRLASMVIPGARADDPPV